MDHGSVLVMRHQPTRKAMEVHSTMNIFERVLALLFPPRQKPLDEKGLYLIGEYHDRIARHYGVEPIHSTHQSLEHWGLRIGEVKEHKRILGKWELFSLGLRKEA
jgi:hypothetical protein